MKVHGLEVVGVSMTEEGIDTNELEEKLKSNDYQIALLDYLEQRNKIDAQSGHENALFLSLQNRRISVRSVENLVKKYAGLVTSLKHITPHKLRST